MPPALKAYWANKAKPRRSRRAVSSGVSMAKRKSKGKGYGRRAMARGNFGDATKGAMSGAVSSVVDSAIGSRIPIPGIGDLAAGFVTGDAWVSHLGGYKAGRSIASGINLGGLLGGNGNGNGAPQGGSF